MHIHFDPPFNAFSKYGISISVYIREGEGGVHKAPVVFPSNWCYSQGRGLGGKFGRTRYSSEKTYGVLEVATVTLFDFVPLGFVGNQEVRRTDCLAM